MDPEDHRDDLSSLNHYPQDTYGSVNDSHSQTGTSSGMPGETPEILSLKYYDVMKGYLGASARDQLRDAGTWRSVVTEFLGSLALTLFFSLTVITMTVAGLIWSDQYSIILAVSLVLSSAVMFLGPCLSPFHVSAFNPVLSFSMVLSGKVGFLRGPLFMVGQLLGAIAGMGLARGLVPDSLFEGATSISLCSVIKNEMGNPKAFSLQFVMSVVLLFSLTNAFMDKKIFVTKWHQIYGAATFATTLAGAHWIGLTANPMIPFAAAVFESCWENQWIYWAASLVGSVLAAILQRSFIVANKSSHDGYSSSLHSRRTSFSFE